MPWTRLSPQDPCYDGKCPYIETETETGAVRVNGYVPGDRSRERKVEFTAAEWAHLVSRLPR